jgi:putative ABC transport system permease protein
MFRTWWSRVAGSIGRDAQDDEFDDEAREHLKLLTDRFAARGLTPEEARYAAQRQFGRVIRIKEDLRARRALPGLDAIARDVRHSARQLRRTPWFTLAAALTLALGIGASTAVFAVLDMVVLRPLPYADSARLMAFRSIDRRGTPHPTSLSYPTFFDFRAGTRVFDRLVCYRGARFTLTDSMPAVQVSGAIVSWDLFPLLGVQPALGRGFVKDEEKPGVHVAVLAHRLWQSRFASDAQIVGKRVRINGNPFTIVGVAPAGFQFPMDAPDVELYTPISQDASAGEFEPMTEQRGARVLDAIGRLKPGVTPEHAQAQMDQIAGDLAKRYPDDNKNVAKTVVMPELERLAGSNRTPLLTLLGAVGLVLFIACANVANLLLARATDRAREFALRTALGASRRALLWQLLVESLVLGVLGAAGGVAIAWGTLRALLPLVGDSIPRIAQTTIDGRVLAFCALVAVATSVIFSLAPAIQAGATPPSDALKQEGRNVARGHTRLRGTLVIGQVTLGLVLLVGAELLITSFVHLVQRDPGFAPDHLLTFDIGASDTTSVADQIAFSDRLRERMAAVPGVRSAAFGFPLPLDGDQMSVSFDIEERRAAPPDRPHCDIAIVTPGFFRTLGVPILKGRDFTDRDTSESPRVLIVNQAFARKYFPGEDIIGKRIESGATNGNEKSVFREIVGVVGDAKQLALSADPDPIYYFPYKQMTWGIGTIVLRTDVPPLQVESAVRAALAELDPMVPMYGIKTGDERAAVAVAVPRFLMTLMASFAGIALVLTAVGLYGVLSYTVARRRREIGVRIALGAGRRAVIGLVMREAMALVIAGLVIGAVLASLTARLLERVLFGVRPGDPRVLVAGCVVLVIAGLTAAYLPASRAASVNPMQALRAE